MHLFIGIISPTWLYGHLAPVATNVRAELLGPVPMPKRRQALFFAPALSCLHLLTIPSEQFEDFADLFGRKRWNFLSKFKFIWHLQNAADKMQDSAHVSSHRDG